MRHALTVALQSFEGGLVVVSHDRHLIKTVADTLWLVADGRLQVFDGDLDDYQQWLKTRAKATGGVAEKPRTPRKPLRDPLAQWRRELEQIERRLATVNSEQTAVETEMIAAGARIPPELIERNARLLRDADALESRWLEVGTAIEEAEARAGASAGNA
jgi:ATP-binding cassette subfamily F protein 3